MRYRLGRLCENARGCAEKPSKGQGGCEEMWERHGEGWGGTTEAGRRPERLQLAGMVQVRRGLGEVAWVKETYPSNL